MNVLNLLIDLLNLLVTATPLGTPEVLHLQYEWLCRCSILLIEQGLDYAISRLETSNQIQVLSLV